MTSGFDSIQVELGFGSNPLGVIVSRTDVTTDVRSITTTRGRGSALELFPAGTAQIVLNNQDGKYDPDNASSPYAGQLLPMVPVRISARDASPATWRIFNGFVQPQGGWQHSYGGGANKIATVTVNCVDMFAILATLDMPAIVPDPTTGVLTPLFTGERTSDYLVDVLGLFGLAASVSGTSLSIMSGYVGGLKALDWIQKVALSEGGAVYVLADGTLQFDNRLDPVLNSRLANVAVTFADDGTGVPYSDFEKEYATVIYNKITVTTPSGISESASDATSIATFTESDYTLDGLFLETAAEAQARAEWYLLAYKDPVTSPSQIVLHPRRSNAVLLAALELDLRNRVVVKFKPSTAAGEITAEVFVRSISHQIDASSKTWTVTLGFESTSRFGFQSGLSYFTLGSSLLGGGDVLAL